MDALNPSALWTFLAVFLGLCGAVAAVGAAARTFSDWRRPYARVRERIETLEKRDADRTTEAKLLLRAVNALLSHNINGNSTDKMKSAQNEIQEYLIERR